MSEFISKKDLLTWMGQLMSERNLVAPTRVDDLLLFRKIDQVEEIVFDFDNTTMSPKEWFYPSSAFAPAMHRVWP
jgi:hypothetical protein